MSKNNESLDFTSVINSSYLTTEDISNLKNKRWVKRFLKVYSKKLKKRYRVDDINKIQNKSKKKLSKEDIEILDFTTSIDIPNNEVEEILGFTKTINISNIKEIKKITKQTKRKVTFEKVLLRFIFILFVLFLGFFLYNNSVNKINASIVPVKNKTEKEALDSKINTINFDDTNLNELSEINSDTIGFIKLNGVNVNYPFMQHKDNKYYTNHLYDKTKNSSGWVFLDYRNDIDNLHKNSIIYFQNNSAFNGLKKVTSYDWYNNINNRTISIKTIDKTYVFEIFSIYKIELESYYMKTYFETADDFNTFIDVIKERSLYDFDINISSYDKLLTLSYYYKDNKRIIVHAKLISGN